jgi:hypothetical protein
MSSPVWYRAAAALAVAVATGEAARPEPSPSAHEIVQRAVERARQSKQRGLEEGFTYRMQYSVEKLSPDGEVEERVDEVYRLVPVGGEPYLQLVSRDGRELTEPELEEERERRREFEETVREQGESPEEKERIEFDQDLVSRYEAELLGVEPVEGRPAYALRYSPLSGDLPERRRIDKVLNRSRGRIWIDRDTYEVARLEFEMTDTVRFLWLLGSVSELRGFYVRQPVGGVWLPDRGEMYLHARMLFRTSRRRQSARWTGFEKLEADAAGTGRPGPSPGARVGRFRGACQEAPVTRGATRGAPKERRLRVGR